MKDFERFLLAILATSVSSPVDRSPLDVSLLEADWKDFLKLAQSHGVASLVTDQLQNFPAEKRPPKYILMPLVGHLLQQEKRYRWQLQTANMLAEALKEKGVQMKVLKGISFSTYYHKSELRECGDCDIYLGEHFEVGNQVVCDIGGIAERGTYKHSHLLLNGLLIENHRYITDFHGTKKGVKLEQMLQKYAKMPGSLINGTALVRPNAHFNAIHLLRHAHGNLMLGGMTLRMIYDWTVFLRGEQSNFDCHQLYADLEECGLRKFAEVLTGVSVRYYGLKLTNEKLLSSNDSILVERVLIDTLRDGNYLIPNESFWHKTKRICARFKRMWRFRELAIESVPMMLWNSFAFSSYMKRDIRLEEY